MIYSVALIKSPEGYAVNCPALPGCWSEGSTRDEALANIREAIRLWLEVAEEDEERAVKELQGVEFDRAIVDIAPVLSHA
jgi:predicted RNase H-like HicB family nuclease